MTAYDPDIKGFLDEKADKYNNPDFIETDPIVVPHQFTRKEDIEIAGFLTASIAWGKRETIIKNAFTLMELMGYTPYDFVMNHQAHHLEKLDHFVHRTFNAVDAKYFIRALKHIYTHQGGPETLIAASVSENSVIPSLSNFHTVFFSLPHPLRTRKHVSDPNKGSSAKKINMYLRWMVRQDKKGVDFGLWKTVSPAILSCPLDVHTGNVARKLGLLTRKQNDLKAVCDLDSALRAMDCHDPVRYDYALFGLGMYEHF
ncbi:MAG: TIGR02757 family protein [Bacteroidota bacterium]